jgi:hypothetical protein
MAALAAITAKYGVTLEPAAAKGGAGHGH